MGQNPASSGGRARQLARLLIISSQALVVALLLWVGIDLLRLRSIDTEDLQASFDAALASRSSHEPRQLDGAMARRSKEPTIWALGASSLVFPESETFVEQLAARLRVTNPSLSVENLGVSGVESSALVEHFEKALASPMSPPDLLLVYAGHNDYNVLYHTSLAREFDVLEPFFYLLGSVTRPGLRHGLTVYLRSRVPPLLERLQQSHLVDFSHLDLRAVNQAIARRLEENLQQIISRCRALGIPVMLVTPVGNLLARPYGSIGVTSAAFHWGQALPDGPWRLSLLRAAQEGEFTTYDIRAKAPGISAIKSLAGPGVVVVDLDLWLEERGMRLDERLFSDYFHFTSWGHARVTDCLMEEMVRLSGVLPRLRLGGQR
jgi:lysophospholipase L1-like esterase